MKLIMEQWRQFAESIDQPQSAQALVAGFFEEWGQEEHEDFAGVINPETSMAHTQRGHKERVGPISDRREQKATALRKTFDELLAAEGGDPDVARLFHLASEEYIMGPPYNKMQALEKLAEWAGTEVPAPVADGREGGSHVQESSFTAGTSGEMYPPSGIEQQLLDYLATSPDGVNVAMMRYAFGGTSQKWTRMLQGMVQQGRLEQHGEMYRLPAS